MAESGSITQVVDRAPSLQFSEDMLATGRLSLSDADDTFARALATYAEARRLASTNPKSEQSLAAYERVLELDPTAVSVAVKLGHRYLQLGKTERAARILEAAARTHPDDAHVHVFLARIHHISGDHEAERDDYRHIIKVDPTGSYSYRQLAATYIAQTNYPGAIKILNDGLRRARETAGLVADADAQGKHLMRNGRLADAARFFEVVNKAHPDNEITALRLFTCYISTKRKDDGFRVLRGAGKDEFVMGRLKKLASEYAASGLLHRAVACIEMMHEFTPDDPDTILQLFTFRLVMRKKREAKRILTKLSDEDVNRPALLRVLGTIYLDTQNAEEAIEMFRRAESAATDEERASVCNSMFYFHYGLAHELNEEPERRDELMLKSIEMDPSNGRANNHLAYSWAELDMNLERGLAFALRATTLEPENGAYIDTLGWIYYKQKQYDLAHKQLSRAYGFMPMDPVITDHLGDVNEARNDHDEAVKLWKASYVLNPDSAAVRRKLEASGIDVDDLPSFLSKDEKKDGGDKED